MKSWGFERQLIVKVGTLLECFDAKVAATMAFLKTGVQVLLACRLILQNTYVFAFFANRCNQVEIFEDNQRDLERATEELSEYYEKDLDYSNIDKARDLINSRYLYCEKRRQILLEHLQEGFENNFWTFTEQ